MAASSSGTIKITGGGNASLRIGTMNEYSWIQSHGSRPLYINELGNNIILSKNRSGNVGIGTEIPKSKLDVRGLERNQFRIYKDGFEDKYLSFWHGTAGPVIKPIKTNGSRSM